MNRSNGIIKFRPLTVVLPIERIMKEAIRMELLNIIENRRSEDLVEDKVKRTLVLRMSDCPSPTLTAQPESGQLMRSTY
ncbi:hypothetical protein E3N88_18557 [Mikania micrantha]|uniref:Uncharacterized protein n=1 Tax=Mikania micrantha TaxID=192012 RepID=A0A5N6NKQ9_9ASTR|nr:hypothetical protein E3N88_18557 [Mikania micrantha]